MENQQQNEPARNQPPPEIFNPGNNSEIGPLELNLLERIENGLNISDCEIEPGSRFSMQSEKEDKKFEGQKQVIAISGWASIASIYERYIYELIFKILLGIVIIYCMRSEGKNLWPICLAFCLFSFFFIIRNVVCLNQHWDGAIQIKLIFWIDLNISVSYLIYFIGMYLYFTKEIEVRHLPIFSFPYLVFSLFLLFQTSDDHVYLNQKRFLIIEALQLLLISLKLADMIAINWSHVIFFFMAASVYTTVIGFFLSMILSCSVTGLIYQNIYRWKLKSLFWMTWYYLTSGIIYIHIIKGVLIYYKDEIFSYYQSEIVYNEYNGGSPHTLMFSGLFLIIFSVVNLIMHLAWKKDIQRFLSKVIYKNEIRKEVTLRFLTKSFTFKLIQVSATYFLKSEKVDENKKEAHEISKNPKNISNKLENELCLFCCEKDPEIMVEPCGHGGVCRSCIINYMKTTPNKCPFCKGKIEKVFIVEGHGNKKEFVAKGEIVFKT